MQTAFSLPPDVRAALQYALAQRLPVTLVVRGQPEAGRPARTLQGTPVSFDLSRDGAERVTIEVAEGETLQKILVDRIERVLPATE